MPYKPKNFITGTMTITNDGVLAQETITVPFPAPTYSSFNKYPTSFNVLHLLSLQIEFVEAANYLDLAADHLIITITPNSETSHPTIIDNDCLFKYAVYQTVGQATSLNTPGEFHMVKKWKLNDVYINKPQFYMQVSLDSAATSLYYKIEYEIKQITAAQATFEAQRRGYTSS